MKDPIEDEPYVDHYKTIPLPDLYVKAWDARDRISVLDNRKRQLKYEIEQVDTEMRDLRSNLMGLDGAIQDRRDGVVSEPKD